MRKRGEVFLLLFIGAFIGSDLRYLESLIFKTSNGFPLGTLVANLSGALILPFLIHYLQDRYNLSTRVILTLSTGVLGSYTTFSTFTADTYRLYNAGQWWLLIIYLTITIVGGFLLALLGNYWAATQAFYDYAKRKRGRHR
ncbi:fluoride efflux transporter CrcB [Companilactobacillus halodurans]|uniref:Fluoride-specific ion channel FluC n=1 Tax=Companilactobacillus halodurans TaxID=2584183 RepID=A0A5P0ZMF7_9LACO|nr:fluoride efflux transporter CrcB [Companilactobacillus halodurans]MQS75394.1 fluoride efflux transporter CrcB [Companilactobacillus halodurans]MQS97339.1 fluoride efflux transporter CrcB [Companilactobacillus halodurans]